MDWLTICAEGATSPCVTRVQAAYLVAVILGIVGLAMLVRRSRDFTTVTLSLMAVAIAINIAVGSLTALLRLPLYLDSVGHGPRRGAGRAVGRCADRPAVQPDLVACCRSRAAPDPRRRSSPRWPATVGLLAGFWASRGVFGLRSDDDRDRRVPRPRVRDRGGGGGDARRPGDVGLGVRTRRTGLAGRGSRRLGSAIVAIGVGGGLGQRADGLPARRRRPSRSAATWSPRPLSRPPRSSSHWSGCCSPRTATSRR